MTRACLGKGQDINPCHLKFYKFLEKDIKRKIPIYCRVMIRLRKENLDVQKVDHGACAYTQLLSFETSKLH